MRRPSRPAGVRPVVLAALAVPALLPVVVLGAGLGTTVVTGAAVAGCGSVTGASARSQSEAPGVLTGGTIGAEQGVCRRAAGDGPAAGGDPDLTGASGRDPDDPDPGPGPARDPRPLPRPEPDPRERPAPAPQSPPESSRAPRSEPPPVAEPRPDREPVRAHGRNAVWERLAQCESSGDWAVDSGNGYSGGLQFDADTWVGYGGTEFAPRAHLATREEQILVATRVRDARGGYGSWPSCAAKLGLPQ